VDVRVRVIGGFEVEGLDAPRLGSRKARTLLKMLALQRGRAVTVELLAERLWPDVAPANPTEQVRVLVSRLRGVLGAERLPRTDAGYALLADWLDLDALAELVADARRRIASGTPGSARAACTAALELVRGPLLPDEPDAEWAEADRSLLARLELDARRSGADAALAAGDHAGAALLAQGALDDDPFDEVLVRILMRGLVGSGRPASALAAYAALREHLAEELGVSPTPETEELHTAILLAPPDEVDLRPAGVTPGASLPGRSDVLAALDASLADAAAGRGSLVLVEGEAGMGKTRLLEVWCAAARAGGATVLAGRCEELTRSLPLQPVLAALDDHLAVLDPDEVAAALGPEADVLARFLGRSAERVGPALPVALRDRGDAQLLMFTALLAVLRRLPAPVVLALDDVHLAGSATVEWLHLVTRRARESPLLVVATQRPEEASALVPATRVVLGPLDAAAAAEVVGAGPAERLLARSGGNPLFLVELAAVVPGGELPATVRDAVDASCERAGPTVGATLRSAAVLGPVVDLELLAAVLRASPVDLLDHLEQGVRRRFLVEQAGTFRFRHDLVREALAASASDPRRQVLHREAGRALSRRSRPDPLAVAFHARLGGDDELAARALVEAAAITSRAHDQNEARRLLDESIALVDSCEARLLRGRVQIMRGEYVAAGHDLDVARAEGAGADALELAAWARHYRRDFVEARRLADEGAATAERDEQRVGCLMIGGWVSQCLGDLPDAELRLEEADRLARGVWRPLTQVWLGGLRVHQGRCAEGVALINPTTINEGVGGAGYPALHAHLFTSLALANLGRADEALRAVDVLDAEVERTGTGRWAGRADNTRGWILRGLGERGAAREANERGLELSTAIAMAEPMAHAHLDLASAALLDGDLDGATAEVAAAQLVGRTHALAWRHLLRARLYEAEIALARGDAAVAAEAAGEVEAEARRIGTARYVALAGVLRATALAQVGEPVDPASVDRLLAELPRVAGLEAWRVTAQLAAAAGSDRWWDVADARVAELVACAGDHAATLQREAGATVARMRTAGRNGATS